ncbi:MAG: DUF882 domain-containing protein [Rhizobiaceae bacterium]
MTKRAFNTRDRRTVFSAWHRCIAIGLFALLGALAFVPVASAETRTLKLYFVHTHERAEITYKKNGRYLSGGLKQINRFLRDWRRNEPTKMDPRLLDLVWEVYRKSGSHDYIHVISGYRSPTTNAMLRKRGRGVAKKSQHMLGKAMDFYLPDVKLSKLRKIGLQMQAGGVGYYPRSGSPFVHLDVGSVRHWPRMSRRELLAMFPDGKTLHVPTDGKPLPGYKQALAAYNKRKGSGGGIVVASTAPEPDKKPDRGERNDGRGGGGLLAAFFGGGQDDEEDSVQAATAPKPVKTIPAPAEKELQPQTPEMIIASLSERDVPLPRFAKRPEAEIGEAATEPLPVEGLPIGADTAEAETVVALHVPRPTPRPELTGAAITSRIETATANPGAKLAYADRDGIDEVLAVMRASQAPNGKGGRIVAVPLPEKRPEEAVVVAALPERGPVLDVGPARFGVPTPRDRDAAGKTDRLEVGSTSDKTGRKAAASPRDIILASLEPVDPREAIATDTHTTRKTDRPSADDQPRGRQAMIVPLPENLSRHAISKVHIARAERRSRAPRFAFDLVGRAPNEVYTEGFSRTARIDNPYRFTGKAVKFLSVAKFN